MNTIIKTIAVIAVALPTTLTFAQAPTQERERLRERDQIQLQDSQGQNYYGWQFMTPPERDEFRARMRAARTLEERQQIRNQHHALMRERARQMGIELPRDPRPMGMQRGQGPGAGMGRGNDMRR
jgi:hypothetical protein